MAKKPSRPGVTAPPRTLKRFGAAPPIAPAPQAPPLAPPQAQSAAATSPQGPIRGALLGRPTAFTGPAPVFPGITDPKKRAYVAQLAQTGHLGDAAQAAGVDLKTGWNWRNDPDDPGFLEAVELARALACDRIEAEITRRALEGVEEPVYQQGRMVGTVRRFSDVLLIFMAKAAMPKKYRERVEHSTEDGKPLVVVAAANLKQLDAKELLQLEALLTKVQPPAEGTSK